MARYTLSPVASTRKTISFAGSQAFIVKKRTNSLDFSQSDPYVITRHSYQIAYLKIFLGKSTAKKSRPPTSPLNQKRQRGSFKRTGEISYRNLSGVTFKDRVNKTDELTLSFANLELSEHDALLAQLPADSEIEMVLGVKGLWSVRRRMIVRDIEPDYNTQIKLKFTLHDTGIKAADGEQTKTFTNKKLSEIFTDLARLSGQKAQVEISDDPVIHHLSMGRRSVAKTVVDLAEKYGLATRFTNNVLYVQEYKLDDQPNARYIFGGPFGNIFSLKLKGTMTGIKGANTVAKRRASGNKKETNTAAKPSQSLAITYLDRGGYFTQTQTNQLKTKAVQPATRQNDKNRTVQTPRTGKDAARLAKGAHLKRTLKVKSGTMVVINNPIIPNSQLLIVGIGKVFTGKYYAGDVTYKWENGLWKVSSQMASTRFKKGTGLKKAKPGKKKKGKETKTKQTKPKLLITYKQNGTYEKKRIGFNKTKSVTR